MSFISIPRTKGRKRRADRLDSIMRLHNRVLVIDVETTGFDPAVNACIDLGAVLLDESLNVVQEFSSLIAPWTGAQVKDEAMKVNRIAWEEMASAPHVEEVINRFNATFSLKGTPPLIAGWNVWFDVSFLRELYNRAQQSWPFSYRLLDVQSVISFHTWMTGISQEQAIEKFLNEQQQHRAFADASHTARLLQLVAHRYLSDSESTPLTTDGP